MSAGWYLFSGQGGANGPLKGELRTPERGLPGFRTALRMEQIHFHFSCPGLSKLDGEREKIGLVVAKSLGLWILSCVLLRNICGACVPTEMLTEGPGVGVCTHMCWCLLRPWPEPSVWPW